MKILLVGGGSGGPVSPLLAVADHIKKHHPLSEFLLVGTTKGPERQMAQTAGVAFEHISAGKLRRYFSWRNFISPFFTMAGFFQSLKIINSYKPDCVFGTGSFVQVPMVLAAWIRRVPVVLHQQDAEAGLANKLCQLLAAKITVSFAHNRQDFYNGLGLVYKKREDKIVFAGNPFREELRHGSRERGEREFNLQKEFPTLLVLGGGTGAMFINNLITDTLPQLTKSLQIIHSTGPGKFTLAAHENYHPYEFISNMADAYAAADIVLSRAGMSTLTELSNLKKLSIIIPMPDTHQEANALTLMRSNAAIVMSQKHIRLTGFVNLLRRLLFASEAQEELKKNIGLLMPHDATEKITEIILKQAEK